MYGPDINSKHGDGTAVLELAWKAGDRFVAVKAGGGNVGLYEAPHYREQVAAARRLGFKVAHYWVSGNQPISVQAGRALASIKPVWRDGDAVAFDNEALDSTGQIRNDHDTTLWVNTVRGTGGLDCPAAAVWVYGSSGSTFRAVGKWPLLKATSATIWAAAYPGPPSMAGTGLQWQVHQYTSGYRYGDGTATDRNVTTVALELLFPKRASRPGGTHEATGRIPKTSTAVTGNPGTAKTYAWKRMQLLAHQGGYVGPDDGDLGVNSWKGVQQRLKDLHLYNGPVDGAPARYTLYGLQAWAGVKKPVLVDDWRKLGRPIWRAIGRKLNTL